MKAVVFLKEKRRMCESYKYRCTGCPLWTHKEHRAIGCNAILKDYPEDAVELVEQWAKEHPRKTYKQDFFEKHPYATKTEKGNPVVCRKNIYGWESTGCGIVCSACWNEEMKEERNETNLV